MIELNGKYCAVFTKYDSPFLSINVPSFPNLEVKATADRTEITEDFGYMYYTEFIIEKVERLLESVKIIIYRPYNKEIK